MLDKVRTLLGNPQNGSPKVSGGVVYSQLVRKANQTLALTLSPNPYSNPSPNPNLNPNEF